MLVSTSAILNQTLCSIVVVTVGGCTYLIASTNEPYLYKISPSAYTHLMEKVKKLMLQSDVATAFVEGADKVERAQRNAKRASDVWASKVSHEGRQTEPHAESKGP